MTIATMGSGIVTRLETITGMTAFGPTNLPGSIDQFPTSLVIPSGEIDYDVSFNDAVRVNFEIIVIVDHKVNRESVSNVAQYCEPTGTYSVRAAINGDKTLGGAADFCLVHSSSGAGYTDWGEEYISTRFMVECQSA